MKITLLTLFCLCWFAVSCFAQSTTLYSIKGDVVDSASNARLDNATICVLNAKDSILYKFTRATANGSFSINNLPKGKLILLVTYPDYADYSDHFTLDSAKTTINFGKINMLLKSKLLADVIVKGERAAIKIKGDTTEFNAGSFKVEANAKVEDLLKQLPGIQVDKDGKITAQGQTVNKVLVDGEEFFGDDPTLVTKNLRADMVDKVQLYDKKSDQAAFTGIDDNKKTKTINIKLKDDKKNGYFGKLDGGLGTNKFYQTQAMYNMFKGKQKFSLYGTLANTGKTGLGWEDGNKYGSSSNNVEFMDGGGVAIYSNGSDDLESFDGRYNGEGIPVARTGGAHYDNKWNSDKESINANYKVGYLNVKGEKDVLTQNNLPTGTINSTNNQNFDNNIFRQKLDGTYQVKLDTSSNLKIFAEGTIKNTKTRSHYDATSIRGNDVLLNQSMRDIDNDADGKIFHANAFYTKKFRKKGRTLSWSLDETYNETDAHGFLNTKINYFNTSGVMDSTQLVNQYKTSNVRNSVFKSNITYSEPLTKYLSAVVNYGLSTNNSNSDRRSYNMSSAGVYNVLDTALSNKYKFNQLYNEGGLILNYNNKKKTIFNVGTKVAAVNYKQVNEYDNSILKRSFINWNPQASYTYKFSQQGNFHIGYNGNTIQPTIDQIQPVIVNTDPLNVTLGNPNLKPSFRNQFDLNYYSYKVLTDQYISFWGSYSFTSNPIVSNARTDSAGKSTYQSTNIGRNSTNYNIYVYTGRKIKGLGLNVGINAGVDGNTSYNIINDALNLTKSANYNVGLQFSKYKEKKFDYYASFGPTYTVSQSSLQSINNNGAGFNGNAAFSVYLPLKFQIGSDANYQYRAKTESFNQSFERFILNARLTKSFFKQDNLKLNLTGYDLLNQNRGFDRSANGNLLTQTTYTNIKRYVMLSVSWDFSKMGGADTKK